MSRLFLGFDAGTQSVKVSVFNESWAEVCSHAHPTTLKYPQPGWVEMDVDEYLELTIQGIRECVEDVKAAGLDPADIAAVMGDGIICGICGVNAAGDAVTPYINYLDSRTQADCDALNAKGLDIWAKETGNPEALCLFPAMFARWLLRENKAFIDSGVKFMHNAPYILLHLAGLSGKDAFIDWGAMSGWGLGYRVEEAVWSEEQLSILGIDPKYMPQIRKPWDAVGTISAAIAERTGLSTKTIVCAGAGDTMQSMLGSGLFEANRAVDVAGTCSMFCVSTSGIIPALSKKGAGLIFNRGSLPDTYFYWGFIRTGGLALRWFKDNVCSKPGDGSHYRVLSDGAAKVPAGCNGVLFLPYLTGGTGEIKSASGCFLNMTMHDDIYVMWRAVLEAIGYDYMEITDTYRAAGVDLSQISVTEGGSRDDLWNQIKANMLGSKVVRYKTAGGALVTDCVFAALAAGVITDARTALEKTIFLDREFPCDASVTKRYRELFAMKSSLVKSDMQAAFERLIAMRSV